ncbi:MAG TPA: hypothetical protein PKL92_06630 [Aquaticitalea sp.]|nr:hypothetical protein [Aquaticitalea sp.]HNU58599.1 hypothetical protein [Aquaticitalea sp.]
MKIQKFFQYAYLFFAVLFTYEAITAWDTDRNRSYMMLLIAALAVFMFFFRRRFAKKIEEQRRKQ